jgi:hypothetical protein
MLTLSLVMIPWDWIGTVIIRSDTFRGTSTTGTTIMARPGSLTILTRPNRNSTPFSPMTWRTDWGSVGGDRLLFVRGILAGVVLGLTMTPVVIHAGTGTPI